jgi:Alginate lyase
MVTPTPDRDASEVTDADASMDDATRPAAPASTEPPSGPPAHGPRRLGPAIVVGAFVVIAVAIGAAFVATRGPAPEPTRPPAFTVGAREPGYLVSVDELRERAAMAKDGVAPYAEAVDELLAWAPDAARREPRPQEPLRIDGTEGPFVDDTATAYGLGLAYVVSGDRKYAQAARDTIMVWVDTAKSTENACPDDGQCQTSLIISRTAPGFVFAYDLIKDAGVMSDADTAAFDDWLRTVILPAASRLPNNWGDAGAFTAFVIADHLGDRDGVVQALERWRVQTDRIAADGHLPEETRREVGGIMYTQEALQYRVAVATIAERYGLDLWDFRGDGGATIRDAIDYLAGYWSHPQDWPWFDGATLPSTGPLWEIVYARYPDPAYAPIVEDGRPFGDDGHSALRWTTLTNGVPIGQ